MSREMNKLSRDVLSFNNRLTSINSASGSVSGSLRSIESAAGRASSGIGAAASKLGSAFGGITSMVAGLATTIGGGFGVQKIVQMSDEFVGMKSRVAMVNDGLQSNAELMEKIHESANRSRATFGSVAELVSRLGLNAKSAFSGNDELIKFSEQINKQFVIGGASAAEMQSATVQLSQALASGTLRGDEFNSIAEQAPTILNSIASYLKVDRGEVRKLASEGKLTAETVKQAVLSTAAETDKAFAEMPMTFSQRWTLFTNNAYFKMQGLLDKISNLTNTKAAAKLFEGLERAVDSLSSTLGPLIDNITAKLDNPAIADNIGRMAEGFIKMAPALAAIAPLVSVLGGFGNAMSLIGGITGNPFTKLFGNGETLGVMSKMAKVLPSIKGDSMNIVAAFSSMKDVLSGGLLKGLSDIGPVLSGVVLPSLGSIIPAISSFAGPISIALAGLFAVGGLGGGLMAALGSVGDVFGKTIYDMLVDARENGPRIIEEFTAGMTSNLPVMIETGAELVTGFLETVATLLPSVLNAGAQMFYTLATGFAQSLPEMVPAAVGVITSLITGLITNLPMILAGGMQIILGLVQGLMNSLPTLIDSIPAMLEGFINGFFTYLPQILVCGSQIIFAIGEGLIRAIPHILMLIPRLIEAIWNGLTSVDWLALGRQIVDGIAEGIRGQMNAIGDVITDLGESALNSVKSALGIHSPSLVFNREVGRQIPAGIVRGVLYAMPQAVNQIEDALQGLREINGPDIVPSTIAPQVSADPGLAMPAQGEMMNMGIATAMDTYQGTIEGTQSQTHAFMLDDTYLQAQQMIAAYNTMPPGVAGAMTGVEGAVVTGMNRVTAFMQTLPALYSSIGVSIMQGLRNGMASQIGAVVDTTNALVAAVKNAFVTGLGIHSPSRVTYEFGTYTGQGFINGLTNTQLVAFVRSIVNDMKGAFGKGQIDLDTLVKYLQGDSVKLVDWMNAFDGGSYVKGVPGSGKGDKALKYFMGMINDNTYGYTFGGHGPTEFDCASSISWALRQAGFNMGGRWDTTGLANDLFALGWQKVPNNGHPQKGDIVMNEAAHVEWAIGNGQLAGFHDNYDGVPGDSSGTEASTLAYYDFPWEYYIRYPGGGFGDEGSSLAEAIKEAYERVILGIVRNASGVAMQPIGNYSASAGVAQWADVVRQALRLTGQSEQYVADILYCIENESGGNPNAQNDWDSNAAMGDPSRGLMQTIGSTFNAYRLPNLSPNIFDPLSNVVAGIRYMLDRYGSIEAVVGPRRGGWYGYASGTNNARRGWAWVGENGPELVNFGGGETVLNNRDSMNAIGGASSALSQMVINRGESASVGDVHVHLENVNVSNDMDIRDVARKIGDYLKDELSYQPLDYHGGI